MSATPRPWRVDFGVLKGSDSNMPIEVSGLSMAHFSANTGPQESSENSMFILNAVNCYDDLVDALEAFLDVGNCKASRDMAIAALTKAKGGQGE